MAEPQISLTLTLQEIRAIISAQDRWPVNEPTPEGFFDVQIKIGAAIEANPAAKQALEAKS